MAEGPDGFAPAVHLLTSSIEKGVRRGKTPRQSRPALAFEASHPGETEGRTRPSRGGYANARPVVKFTRQSIFSIPGKSAPAVWPQNAPDGCLVGQKHAAPQSTGAAELGKH